MWCPKLYRTKHLLAAKLKIIFYFDNLTSDISVNKLQQLRNHVSRSKVIESRFQGKWYQFSWANDFYKYAPQTLYFLADRIEKHYECSSRYAHVTTGPEMWSDNLEASFVHIVYLTVVVTVFGRSLLQLGNANVIVYPVIARDDFTRSSFSHSPTFDTDSKVEFPFSKSYQTILRTI